MDSWIVAISKTGKETWGAANVQRQGFETYFPRFIEPFVNRNKQIEHRIRSLFPRYVFVRTDGRWYFLLSTFGLIGVVLKGEVPAIMPDEEIARMKARENANGLIELPPPPLPPRYGRGQRLKITYGPFSGKAGICQGDNANERVHVLLEFLGARRSVLIARDALQAAA